MIEWIGTDWAAIPKIGLSAFVVFVAVIVYTRLVGLRSFAKMSSFDFAMTVAVGSLLGATIVAKNPNLLHGVAALGSVFLLQWLVAAGRRWSVVSKVVDNQPLLLMCGDNMLHDNMRKARVTEGDIWSKLREANVLSLDQVRAVVFEATGDISVLHGDACADESEVPNHDNGNSRDEQQEGQQEDQNDQAVRLDPVILTGVQGVDTQKHKSWRPTVQDSDYQS